MYRLNLHSDHRGSAESPSRRGGKRVPGPPPEAEGGPILSRGPPSAYFSLSPLTRYPGVHSMSRSATSGLVAVLVGFALVLAGGCATGAGQESTASSPGLPPLLGAPAADTVRPGHSAADVQFMIDMIPHHAQALVMAALVPERSERREINLLAERMAISQRGEIALMRQWLDDVGAPVPPSDGGMDHAMHGAHAGHGAHGDHGAADGHAVLMPGMLTDEEIAQLADTRGDAFDRLFLTFMIRHHEGALVMVDALFASPGAAQDDFVYMFASDVYADQTTEIHHMNQMLSRIP
ncbi:MAG: DUF305 domain-containing protein [Gemmatimonadales bacterium]|nr:MAG: DUF305 domain-containing protein [Gemmatimonadales bacterium]